MDQSKAAKDGLIGANFDFGIIEGAASGFVGQSGGNERINGSAVYRMIEIPYSFSDNYAGGDFRGYSQQESHFAIRIMCDDCLPVMEFACRGIFWIH